jgi:hypothetical protein
MIWQSWTKLKVDRCKVEYDLPDWFALRPEIKDWLDRNVGHKCHFVNDEALGDWFHDYPMLSDHVFIFFKNPDHAMLFKLTWL